MTLVVLERTFERAHDLPELERQAAPESCLSAYRVKPLRTFLSRDGLHAVSLYTAPDAEAVRSAQRKSPLPISHCWPATPVIDEARERPRGYSLVVAQRALPPGATLEQVQYLATDPKGCGRRLRLVQIGAYLSFDCNRMCCVYYAPDLETVRVANREAELPHESLWSGALAASS